MPPGVIASIKKLRPMIKRRRRGDDPHEERFFKCETTGGDDQYEAQNNDSMDVVKGVLAAQIRGLRPGNAARVIEATPLDMPEDDPIIEMAGPRRRHV